MLCHLSWIDVDVGNDEVDDGQTECGAGDGHPVHQGVRYLRKLSLVDFFVVYFFYQFDLPLGSLVP